MGKQFDSNFMYAELLFPLFHQIGMSLPSPHLGLYIISACAMKYNGVLSPTSYLETMTLKGLPGLDICTHTTSANTALKGNLCILPTHQYFQMRINGHKGFLGVCTPAVKVYVRARSQQASRDNPQHSWVRTSTQEPKPLALCCCQEPRVLTKWGRKSLKINKRGEGFWFWGGCEEGVSVCTKFKLITYF